MNPTADNLGGLEQFVHPAKQKEELKVQVSNIRRSLRINELTSK